MTSEAPNRLRRAEAVLQFRTSRLVLVAERCVDTHNLTAILRTAELMGIQNVYTIDQDLDISKQQRSTVSSGANFWVDVHNFKCTESCVNQLKKDGFEIWATDLGDGATSLAPSDIPPIPSKLAIVMGRETDGISDQMRALSDRLVYLPMYGFTESFNLGVATGMTLQRIIDAEPSIVGSMTESERAEIRRRWYKKLGGLGWEELYKEWLENPPPPLESLRPSLESRRPRMKKKLAKRLKVNPKHDAT